MICKERVRGHLCSRTCFEDDKRCYIHIRKWLQNQLKKFDIVIDFPRTCKKVTDALNLVKSTDPTYGDARSKRGEWAKKSNLRFCYDYTLIDHIFQKIQFFANNILVKRM